MNFADAIVIIIPGIFANRMAHCAVSAAGAGDVIVGTTLVGVEGGGGFSLGFNLGLDGDLLGIVADFEPNLTRLPTDKSQNGGTVIGHRPFSAAFVGATARWVIRVIVFAALFSSILKHFIGFCHRIRQAGVHLMRQSQLLQSMSTCHNPTPVPQPVAASVCLGQNHARAGLSFDNRHVCLARLWP